MSSEDGCELRDKFTAGFKLLDKFQDQWEHIHAKSEENVIKSKSALRKIDTLSRSCAQRLTALDDFLTSYKSLSKLEEQINSINGDLKLLENCFVQLESLLLVLKERKQQISNRRCIANMEAQCELQVQERRSLSAGRKERLRLEHLQRVEEFERKEQQKLEERRQILGKAFEEEKIEYLERSKET